MSLGKLDKLTPRTSRAMLEGTDFSAYTPWYKKGNDMGIYSHPDSFPSGHTLSATCSFLGILICSASKKLEKLMPLARVTVIIRTRQKCSIKAIFVAFAVALRQQDCHLKTPNLIFTPSIFDALQFSVCRFGLNQGTKHS